MRNDAGGSAFSRFYNSCSQIQGLSRVTRAGQTINPEAFRIRRLKQATHEATMEATRCCMTAIVWFAEVVVGVTAQTDVVTLLSRNEIRSVWLRLCYAKAVKLGPRCGSSTDSPL